MKLDTQTGKKQVSYNKVCENQAETHEVIGLSQQHNSCQQNSKFSLKQKIDSAAVYNARVNKCFV